MMRLLCVLSVALCLTTINSEAIAQPESPITAHSLEIRAWGYYTRENLTRDKIQLTQGHASVGAGYLLTSIFEVFMDVALLHSSAERRDTGDGYRNTYFGGLLGMIGNYPSGNSIVPFLSVGAGVVGVARDNDDLHQKTTVVLPSLDLGARLMFSRNASINLSAYYEHLINALHENGTKSDEYGIRFGVSLYLFNE